jgi:pimeloyl-ACP methyl ester carboxylesterase
MATTHRISTGLLRACLTAAVAALAAAALTPSAHAVSPPPASTRVLTIEYRAHDGVTRNAYVVLPGWYGPRNHPPIPLIISPHGRGLTGRNNVRIWGGLPARGPFAVVSPDGHGRRLSRYSWGARGQISDLARMPTIVMRALPWLRVDRNRIYAFGGSMGGQETLLLVALHPRLLAGAVAVDSLVDFPRQYENFLRFECDASCRRAWDGPIGEQLQWLARREVGGSPATTPNRYAARSPLAHARQIAVSCVPLQVWWSRTDRIVLDSRLQSGRLVEEIRRLNPQAPIDEYVGAWPHTRALRARYDLPVMLAGLGLLPKRFSIERLGAKPHVISGTGCTNR